MHKRANFFTVKAGHRIYLSNKSMRGVVSRILEGGRAGRRTVEVRLDDGRVVSYRSAQTFAAFEVKQPETLESIEIDHDVTGVEKPKRVAPRPSRRRIPVSKEPKASKVRRRYESKRPVPIEPKNTLTLSEDERPSLPGPPVPKPKRGVWDNE